MIVEFIISAVLDCINWLISLLPSFDSLPNWLGDFLTLAGYALNFIPADVWIITLGNVALWKFGFIAWAIVEWVYKKIPGVD